MHSGYFPFPLLGYEYFKLVKENDSDGKFSFCHCQQKLRKIFQLYLMNS